ncbi:MAG TPA: Uma2 family endonuclease [Blastocatellia bacterium]|nr:Uma2 family endonuclease [Blastocatellia bacterium]
MVAVPEDIHPAPQRHRGGLNGEAPLVRRYTIEEFVAVAEALPDDRLELINGEIVMAPPPDLIHMQLTDHLLEILADHLKAIRSLNCRLSGSRYYEVPKTPEDRWGAEGVSGLHEVCPDVSIYYRDYLKKRRRPPAPLVIEVLSVSHRVHIDRDLVTKPEIYAALEIPVYWVIDRRDRSVWVHTAPEDGKYTRLAQYKGRRRLLAPGLEFLAITPAQIFAD